MKHSILRHNILGGLIVCGLAVSALLTAAPPSTAFAADMDFKAPPPPPVAFTWTGCYVGANVGGSSTTSGWSDILTSLDGLGSASTGIGVVGGGQVGCNYQIRHLVVGLEGEFDWSSANDQNSYSSSIGGIESLNVQTQNPWDATLALRVGFAAWDNLLIYGLVGGAEGHFHLTATYSDPTTYNYDAAGTASGVVFGGGFEYALAQNWTAKFQYEYIDYGNPSFAFTGTGAGLFGTSSFNYTFDQHVQIVKVGVNYLFH